MVPPHVGREREKERREGERETAIASLSYFITFTRSLAAVYTEPSRSRFAADPRGIANDTDRRDSRAHADGWVARYIIIKTPSVYKSTYAYERLREDDRGETLIGESVRREPRNDRRGAPTPRCWIQVDRMFTVLSRVSGTFAS